MTDCNFNLNKVPLVSVVITSYNKAKFLNDAVFSVVNQDYSNIEIIIVNDGSLDNTKEVSEELIKKYKEKRKIIFIDKENGGVSDARNAGGNVAAGFYLSFLDGDDMFSEKYISTAVKLMQENHANLFYCNVDIFGNKKGEWIPHKYSSLGIRYDNCIPIASVFEKELFNKSGGFKVSLGFSEDWEFWINLSRQNFLPIKCEEKLFLYRSNNDGIASTYIEGAQRDCLTMCQINDDDLYSVEEVLKAHENLILIKEKSFEREKALDMKHPNEWFLKFYFGVIFESKKDYQNAFNCYVKALELTNAKNWQVAFRLSKVLKVFNRLEEAKNLEFLVRTLRPDMWRFLDRKI